MKLKPSYPSLKKTILSSSILDRCLWAWSLSSLIILEYLKSSAMAVSLMVWRPSPGVWPQSSAGQSFSALLSALIVSLLDGGLPSLPARKSLVCAELNATSFFPSEMILTCSTMARARRPIFVIACLITPLSVGVVGGLACIALFTWLICCLM